MVWSKSIKIEALNLFKFQIYKKLAQLINLCNKMVISGCLDCCLEKKTGWNKSVVECQEDYFTNNI